MERLYSIVGMKKVFLFSLALVGFSAMAANPSFLQFGSNDFVIGPYTAAQAITINTNRFMPSSQVAKAGLVVQTTSAGFQTNYSTVDAAVAAQSPGDTFSFYGTLNLTNSAHFTNCTLKGYGSWINNWDTNQSPGEWIAIVPVNCSVYGLTISNAVLGTLQGGIGIDSRSGHPACTNFWQDLTIYGDTDGGYFKHTNTCDLVVVGCYFQTMWDNFVIDGPVNTHFKNTRFFVTGASTSGGAALRGCFIVGGTNDFTACDFKVAGVTNYTQSAALTSVLTASSSNSFVGCRFVVGGNQTNAIALNLNGSNKGGYINMVGCTIDQNNSATNLNLGIKFAASNPGFLVFLRSSPIFGDSSTNFQVSLAGTANSFYYDGASAISRNRLTGATAASRGFYSGGEIGTANGGVPLISATNFAFFGTNAAPASTNYTRYLVVTNYADNTAWALPLIPYP